MLLVFHVYYNVLLSIKTFTLILVCLSGVVAKHSSYIQLAFKNVSKEKSICTNLKDNKNCIRPVCSTGERKVILSCFPRNHFYY